MPGPIVTRLLPTLVACLLLGACSADIKDAQQILTDSLAISKDVEFRNLESYPGGVVCGEYSAYESHKTPKADFKPFIVVRGSPDKTPREFDLAFYCSDQPAQVLLEKTGIGLFDANNEALAKITADYSTLAAVLEPFYKDNFFYPSMAQGLEALVRATDAPGKSIKVKEGGYLESLPVDPWGRPYRYFEEQWGRTKGYYVLTTLGADGKEGGEGENKDITSDYLSYLQHIAFVLEE